MKIEPQPTRDFRLGIQEPACSRRHFLAASAIALASIAVSGCRSWHGLSAPDLVIDIHQHASYHDRPDAALLAHQRTMGVRKTILLPAGRPVNTASTHDGVSNGLQAKCLGNEVCYRLAQEHSKEFLFGANEVPDLPDAIAEIEKYLK